MEKEMFHTHNPAESNKKAPHPKLICNCINNSRSQAASVTQCRRREGNANHFGNGASIGVKAPDDPALASL